MKKLGFAILLVVAGSMAGADYKTIDEAAKGVGALARDLNQRQDRRSLFPSVYVLTIEASEAALNQGKFHHPAWVRSLIVNYANIYLRTITNELAGHRASLPVAWQQEFTYIADTHAWSPADPGGALWSPDLDMVYGIHVHITRDLVEALLVTPTDFNDESEHADFLYITEVLRGAMSDIWNVFLGYEQQIHLSASIEQPAMMKWIADLRAQAWVDAKPANALSAARKTSYLEQLDATVARESRQSGIFLLL